LRALLPVVLGALLFASALETPAGAAGTGTLQAPHSDAGVDTNGDSLFNFLRINVSVRITSPGTFVIGVVLKDDLDLGTLTESSLTASLAAGNLTVSLLLDGPDIYNGGVDGPYYAHITLASEYGEVLSTDLHRTAAYRFTDFQPYAAAFVPPQSERTWDNDSDGLVNWIDLGFTLDVATAGAYTLSSLLTDSSYTVSVRWTQTVRLNPGRSTLHQLFLGYPMRVVQKSGPYLVTNSLTDSRGTEIGFLFVTTRAYDYAVFEGPPAVLAPPHADRAVDTDGDGLYDVLRIDVNLSVEMAGQYSLRGQLFGGSGFLITETAITLSLGAGRVAAPLTFDGWTLFESATNGPYSVKLQVYDSSGLLLSEGTHATAAYSYTDFEPRLLYLDPPHEDSGVDLNGNGKFDFLRVLVHLEVSRSVRIEIKGGLRQGVLASDLAQASNWADLAAGPQVVPLDFAGPELAAAGVEGPYWVVISVYQANGPLLDQGNHRTSAYSPSDFDTGALQGTLSYIGDRGEDVDGNGLLNRLRVELLVNVTIGDRYRLEGLLLRDGRAIAAAASTQLMTKGPSRVDLLFGGPDLFFSGLDGPYILQTRLTTFHGNATVAAADFLTSPYAATAFERAVPVIVTGRVSATRDGSPLAGASVWLVDYVNFTSREVVADSEGRFTLSAFEGDYWVVVDHPEANARTLQTRIRGNASFSFSLLPTARNLVRDSLAWTGWDQLTMAVRYVFATDGPSLRFRLDWQEGNRDGWIDSSEWSELVVPFDPIRDVMEKGNSTGGLSVNGRAYLAVSSLRLADFVSGEVTGTALPSFEVSRAFQSEDGIGTPGRLEILLGVASDTLTTERSMRLYTPGGYRFVSVSDTPNVSVRARRNTLPVYVDPGMGSNLSEPPLVMDLQLLFYSQITYLAALPSPPSELVAVVAGGEVSLTWAPPTTNVDGSRLTNLAGYRIYRFSSSNGSTALIGGPLVLSPSFVDHPGVGTFSYWVTAVTTDGLESLPSDPVAVSVDASQLLVTVVDSLGAPVSEASVRLEGSQGKVVARSVTDDLGRATLSALPGTYTLRVEAFGFSPRSILVTLPGTLAILKVTLSRDSPGVPSGLDALPLILAGFALSGTGGLVILRWLRCRGGGVRRAGASR